jgi:hypothetical protein
MGVADTFPVDADYTVTRTKESNVLRARLDSALEYFRQKGPPRRIFMLVFNRRSSADWHSIENFRLSMMTDFFTWIDKTANRSYSVFFDTEPTYEEAGNEMVNIKLQLIEAAGAAMETYPTFAAGNPYISIPVASAVDLGVNGWQFLYAGYGFRVNPTSGGGYTSIYLDEVVTGAGTTNEAVPLGLHRVRVMGGAPTSLDYLI